MFTKWLHKRVIRQLRNEQRVLNMLCNFPGSEGGQQRLIDAVNLSRYAAKTALGRLEIKGLVAIDDGYCRLTEEGQRAKHEGIIMWQFNNWR